MWAIPTSIGGQPFTYTCHLVIVITKKQGLNVDAMGSWQATSKVGLLPWVFVDYMLNILGQ